MDLAATPVLGVRYVGGLHFAVPHWIAQHDVVGKDVERFPALRDDDQFLVRVVVPECPADVVQPLSSTGV